RPCSATHASALHHPAPPSPYPLSLQDALPIFPHHPLQHRRDRRRHVRPQRPDRLGLLRLVPDQLLRHRPLVERRPAGHQEVEGADRKSTRLNSSHVKISYAVFCLKKKNI